MAMENKEINEQHGNNNPMVYIINETCFPSCEESLRTTELCENFRISSKQTEEIDSLSTFRTQIENSDQMSKLEMLCVECRKPTNLLICKDNDMNNTEDKENSCLEHHFLWASMENMLGILEECPRSVKQFYRRQSNLLEMYLGISRDKQDIDSKKVARKTSLYSMITFWTNVMLLLGKAVAASLSGSMAILSSLVDSVVDLVSGILLWITARTIRRQNKYKYPHGMNRLEPLAVVILSVVMVTASLQLVKESILKLISLAKLEASLPIVDAITITIAVTTIVVKCILYFLCKKVDYPTVQALAQDHRNDVLSNTAAIICGYIGSKELVRATNEYALAYVDPIGGILISIYIAITWCIMGKDQGKTILGRAAPPGIISHVAWTCIKNRPEIQQITDLHVVHDGYTFLVYVTLELSPLYSFSDARRLMTAIQNELEMIPKVGKAHITIKPADRISK